MAKQEIIEFENGATLIYQKRSVFDGNSFVIGFRGGAQLDGKYSGLSHLLEHLLFRSSKNDLTKNILDNIRNNSFNINAYTTTNDIRVVFSSVAKNTDLAINDFLDRLTNTEFSPEQIAREIDVVKQEINLTLDKARRTPQNAFSLFLDSIEQNPDDEDGNPLAILGSPRTLKTITPDILKKYVERYFNTDNLVISITSNRPKDEVVAMVEDKILSRLKPAESPNYIVDFPMEKYYNPVNMLCAVPNPNMSNVSINLLFRDKAFFDESQYLTHKVNTDPNKEYAYDVVESYMMNTMGGLLFDHLRVKKSLVYSYGLEHLDLGTTSFKSFNAVTSPNNLNRTIKAMCDMVKDLGQNGMPRDMFESVKTALVDQNAAVLQRFKDCSAEDNYEALMYGEDLLDYSLVSKHIANMTYEDFNATVTRSYKTANVSLLVDGGFESSKVYSIIDVEEMLGNHAHSAQKPLLNQPRAEATMMVEPVMEIPQMQQLDSFEEDSRTTVNIEDQEL